MASRISDGMSSRPRGPGTSISNGVEGAEEGSIGSIFVSCWKLTAGTIIGERDA
jgi:hypothetical protein